MDAKKELEKWMQDFRNATTELQKAEHKKQFDEFLSSLSEEDRIEFKRVFTAGAMDALKNAKQLVREVNVKHKLSEIQNIISFSYIAENYFGKSRQWLSQRINRSIVNGKPVNFTADELGTLENALKDISAKILETSRLVAFS